MTKIERDEYLKVVKKLIKEDEEGNMFIDFNKFNSLYFTDNIKRELISILLDNNVELRTGDSKKEKFDLTGMIDESSLLKAVFKAEDDLELVYGRRPTSSELAKYLNMSEGLLAERIENIIDEDLEAIEENGLTDLLFSDNGNLSNIEDDIKLFVLEELSKDFLEKQVSFFIRCNALDGEEKPSLEKACKEFGYHVDEGYDLLKVLNRRACIALIKYNSANENSSNKQI